MMEGEDQYMDDLFGEHEPVHNSPPAFHKGLNAKLEELHENGCCQYVFEHQPAALSDRFLGRLIGLEMAASPQSRMMAIPLV